MQLLLLLIEALFLLFDILSICLISSQPISNALIILFDIAEQKEELLENLIIS